MYQQELFAIKDSKSNTYQNPWYSLNEQTARRQVHQSVNSANEENLVAKYPEDFDLYKFGSFNQMTGKLEVLDTPVHVCKAISLKEGFRREAPKKAAKR